MRGVPDGVAEHVAGPQGSVVPQQQHPGVEGPRDHRRQQTAARHQIEPEVAIMGDGGASRGRALAANDLDRPGTGIVQYDRNFAAGTVQVGLDHLQHEPGRDGGVEGIAAPFQNRHAGRRRQPMGRGDDAEGSSDLRTGGEGQSLVPRITSLSRLENGRS